MDPKRPSVNIVSPTRRLLTRQLTQTNFREKPVNNIMTPTKEPKRLPRSNSGVSLSKLQQIENFMPKHLLQKNLEAFKAANVPLIQNTDDKLDAISPLNARSKRDNEPLDPNALFRNRILKPQIPKRKESGTPPFIASPFLGAKGRESPQLSPANDLNNNFQKEGFDTLLSFFHQSSSKSPARIFPEAKRIDTLDIPKTPQANNRTPANGFTRERPESIAQRVRTGDLEGGDQRNWGYVEQIIAHLSVATGTTFTWKHMDNELEKIITKKKAEYWNELIAEHKPENVEILVVNMMELVVKWNTEMEVINGESIAEKIDEYMKEESPHKNEALHLLIYFHKKESTTKTLVLSKYCFYFAKNAQFNEDLKSEKDIIIYYFLILGLCNFKITLEHEPIRKIKITQIKERAINILKGEETPLKSVLEWVTRRFNNHVIVEKTIFNFNNITTASSTYLFNIRSYIKSMYSKLSLFSKEEFKPKGDLIFIKKANITQTGVVPFIQQLALPKSNLSPKRSLTLTLSTVNTGEAAGEVNPGRKTPVLKKRTKIVTNIRDKLNIKFDDINSRYDLKTTKATTIPSFFDTPSYKGNKTDTNFYKPEFRLETTAEHSEDGALKPEILNMKFDKNAKRNSSATPTLRKLRRPTETRTPKGPGNLALSPWRESTDLPVFEQSPLLPKPHNLVLKSLAEELIDEGDEHPSTLRLYLEEKGNKKDKV